MGYRYKVISVPAEPISLSEAKTHVRVDTDDEDLYIASLITAARELVESTIDRALAPQTLALYLDTFPPGAIELARPPLQSVTGVSYKDCNGATVTLTPNTDYLVDADSPTGRIVPAYGKAWPSFTPWPVNPIKVEYSAGTAECPAPIRHAMLLMVGHMYANRESGSGEALRDDAVRNLLAPYRNRWWG